jgi:aspartate/glutamate racemase
MRVQKTVVAVHTGTVTVATLSALAAELMPDVRLVNLVDDSLLKDTIAAGAVTPSVTRRLSQYMTIGQEMGADMILNCCSSIGEAADSVSSLLDVPMLKIDIAMAEEAVRRASRIGVAATVQTTLDPTTRLVERTARSMNKDVQVTGRLCAGAFEALLAGDAAQHDAIVAQALTELAAEVDLIVLAQVSMGRVAGALGNRVPCPVLTSPKLGMERLAQRVAALDDV